MDEITDLGLELVARLEETVNEKVFKAIALRIRTKVSGARSDPDMSARRWPFELIQNAHDAGTRAGQESMSLTFEYGDGVLRFEHNAAPFTIDDFAALLTGGSSKDFMSAETTGRFGTGFLVTHVLSERVSVRGILEVDGTYRGFDVNLDRPNDEEVLLRNVQDSQQSLRHTRHVENLEQELTASFEYEVDDERIALAGLEALEEALPFLFATCRRLGEIVIRRGEHEVVWRLESATKPSRFLNKPSEFRVTKTASDDSDGEWRVIRRSPTFSATGSMVVALARRGESWTVYKPANLASIFRQLPLLGGPILPGWVIIDGNFDVEQERRGIYLKGDQERPLRDAFASLPGLMKQGNLEKWENVFRIAHLALPGDAVGGNTASVWSEILSKTAMELASLPLVSTARGEKVPCSSETDGATYADFIRRSEPGLTHGELWELAASCTEADPPERSTSEGWSEVVESWEALGVKLSWIDLETVGARARKDVTKLEDLNVEGDPVEWLSLYLEAVGKTWEASGVTKSNVKGLLPDQNGLLRDAGELRIDGGVPERIKTISASMAIDIAAEVLDQDLIGHVAAENLASALFAIKEATNGELVEDEVIGRLSREIGGSLPEDQKVPEEKSGAVGASIDLLLHLWESSGQAAQNAAWNVPILAADGSSYKPGRRRTMVLPVSSWPEAARPFASAYPPGRILHERYAAGGSELLNALSTWNIAHAGLIVTSEREEIQERGIKPISADPVDFAGATLRVTKFAQIALLEPELIQYCRITRERACALLGLLVCYVAPTDDSWRTTVELPIRVDGAEKSVTLTPSLWLSDLRSKPWIPHEEDGEVVHHPATTALVADLLEPGWLRNNPLGAELLVRHFGLDALDVGLLAAATDEQSRKELRNSLARIVAVAGGNAQIIDELVEKARLGQRNVNLMRKLGLAVQQAVLEALEARGLQVDPDDYGYDFLVSQPGDDPQDLSAQIKIAEYKLEVKTTTTGEPRLTPLQASTCADEPDTFVLCVVDLRDYPSDVHDVEWTSHVVSPLCRLVAGGDIPIGRTVAFVQGAEVSDIPIRNATALRYAIGTDIWENGQGFEEWVSDAFG
ncbi:hypothetical protein [Bradyrhizobium sp. dw_411]|uniref:sacsin N-terminal ATP-binding-like domain-containing protein n=1 Tax=Bradyrhizobium sp. dw_411 TaxID=2720082 RepID=UPI001BCCC23A|nr:hypothetical protein [Bradyrhizobium sp. dw_411]